MSHRFVVVDVVVVVAIEDPSLVGRQSLTVVGQRQAVRERIVFGAHVASTDCAPLDCSTRQRAESSVG